MVEITAFYEMILKYDAMSAEHDFGLYKNLGLAYMHMVRMDNAIFRRKEGVFLIEGVNIFDDLGKNYPAEGVGDYKDFASMRWGKLWRKFLTMKGSESDSSYATVKNLIEKIFGGAK